MAKGNQKSHKEVVRGVLAEIASERRQAHADAQRRLRELREHVAAVEADPETRRVVQAFNEAETDDKAHARYESKMDAAEYGSKKAKIAARLADANAALRALRKREQERVAPMEEALQAAQKKAMELDREWAGHLRIAKAAGVDLSAYWTPESGVPAEGPPKATVAA